MNTLGIDIGSTTVKIALLNKDGEIIFSDYQRHYANIQETLAAIIEKAYDEFGDLPVAPVITGSGGLTLSKYLNVPFVQEVVAVATSLKDYAPHTDVAIELGGEDAKIIYFTGGIDQRMNGICAGGTGSFIDQMATLLKTDASGLNEYAKNYNLPNRSSMRRICQNGYSTSDQRRCNQRRSLSLYFSGSGQSDDQRSCLW